jgi:hypothetical protein
MIQNLILIYHHELIYHQCFLVKNSTFAKSVAKSGDNNVDFNEAVLENGAEMANTIIKKNTSL